MHPDHRHRRYEQRSCSLVQVRQRTVAAPVTRSDGKCVFNIVDASLKQEMMAVALEQYTVLAVL